MSELLVVHVRRPYATEAEWLREEGWTIARKSAYLIGVPSQPEGTLVRCELSLVSGTQLLVAEGLVVKHVSDHGDRPPGLVVRYRRLSTASSQFISRVLSARGPADGSSPSAVEHPIPTSQVDATPVREGPAPTADDTVTATLERLHARTGHNPSTPPGRYAALDRLRHRSAQGGGT